MFEVEEWLHSRIGLNFRSGLDRTTVDLLGNPDKSYPIIHVTGLMERIYHCFYERVIYGAWQKSCDLYPPHIISSMIESALMGKPIADADFIRLAEQVKEMEKDASANP